MNRAHLSLESINYQFINQSINQSINFILNEINQSINQGDFRRPETSTLGVLGLALKSKFKRTWRYASTSIYPLKLNMERLWY
jgi:hypothetical protein